MKAEVHFLNVGWGDAHFIVTPSGELTLIDGGCGDPEACEDHPLAWMKRRNADTLDWMIVTHLHEDHLEGLLQLAEEKKVRHAVLPYPSFAIPGEDALQKYGDRTAFMKVYRLLEKYIRLLTVLEKQGTKIIMGSEYGSKDREVIWSREGYTLIHMYPWTNDPLTAWDLLRSALNGYREGAPDWHVELERFFQLSNNDSSVHCLTWQDGEKHEAVLFGGDLFTEGWLRLSQRTDLHATVWKAPHHGMPDAFNEATLALVKPQYSIIPISTSLAEPLKAHWSSLGSAAGSLRMTGEFPVGKGEKILDGAIKVYMGCEESCEKSL